VSRGAAAARPAFPPTRRWLGVVALALFVASLLWPLSQAADRYELWSLARYAVFALAIPPLVVLAAPWSRSEFVARLARRRARHRELRRSGGFVLLYAAVLIWWFTPTAADAVAGHGWLTVVEGLTLIPAGIALWLELLASPPLVPRVGPLLRSVLAAGAMWLVWIEAYVVGLSHADWYPRFHHTAGHGLSAAADQQIAAVVLWFVATAVFVPAIFANALSWLRSEEDPDGELYALMREERRRAWPSTGPT